MKLVARDYPRWVSSIVSLAGILTFSGSNFFKPTVLTNATDNMLICQTEIFGPVAPIMRFTSEDEVIERANGSDAGLASYLFTRDLHRAARVAEKLHFGMVSLNTGAIPDTAAP